MVTLETQSPNVRLATIHFMQHGYDANKALAAYKDVSPQDLNDDLKLLDLLNPLKSLYTFKQGGANLLMQLTGSSMGIIELVTKDSEENPDHLTINFSGWIKEKFVKFSTTLKNNADNRAALKTLGAFGSNVFLTKRLEESK